MRDNNVKQALRNKVSDNNKKKYDKIPNSHISCYHLISNYRSDYFTFLTGFMSSVFIEEVYNVLSISIAKSPKMFFFAATNSILLLIVNITAIKFVLTYQDLQDTLKGKTSTAKLNYFIEYYDEHYLFHVKSLNKKRVLLKILIGLLLILNTIKFVDSNKELFCLHLSSYFDNTTKTESTPINADQCPTK